MKEVTLKHNELDVDEYLLLRSGVHWKVLSREQAKLALERSLYIVTAYVDGECVGMGRLVGDGAVICYVQDLVIPPQAQGYGIGSLVLSRLTEYVESLRLPGTEMMFDLMCAKGRERFYEAHGFLARPTEKLGPGMIQYMNDNRGSIIHD